MSLLILLHSSKTMRTGRGEYAPLGVPQFTREAEELVKMWRGVDAPELQKLMKISEKKADEVAGMFSEWSARAGAQYIPAINAFSGDIYSGLQTHSWSAEDRQYAHTHLLILSGLYGALRACDGVLPYRLEMGYTLPDGRSLYAFWGQRLATAVSSDLRLLVNLSAVEYTKAFLPYLDGATRVVTPKFLTVHEKTGVARFVTVHAKIARGAFAGWLVRERIADAERLAEFAELGYKYDAKESTPEVPVFVCERFEGLGMSVRG